MDKKKRPSGNRDGKPLKQIEYKGSPKQDKVSAVPGDVLAGAIRTMMSRKG